MSIVDNTARSRFEYLVEGHVAFINYRRTPGMIALTHAEVPPEIEGRGVGSHMAREVLDAIRASGEKVIPQCSFVEAFIRRNPEYQDLLTK
ncbi:MAG TPA: GNAT family N-acetyltransferase [Rudaea sp.]|nr:GNAT family N-acetyltransferase [Rudaea sp.]